LNAIVEQKICETDTEVNTPPPKRRYKMASEVEPAQVAWFWKPYFARGFLTLIDGDSGCGKSWITYAIAAALSTGRPFPGSIGRPYDPRNIVICNCEDPADVMTVPRLRLLGADLSRIAIFDSKALECLDPRGQLRLREAVLDLQAHYFTIDTITPYLPKGVTTKEAVSVRPTLRWLADLAAEANACGTILRHLRKAETHNPLYAGQGTVDFVATCRSLLIAGKNPTEDGGFILAQAKCNIGMLGDSRRYGFDAQGRLEWRGISPLKAEDLITPRQPQQKSKLQGAVEWLAEQLEKGARPQHAIVVAALQAGHTEATLTRAKGALGVDATKQGKSWIWSLPAPKEGDQSHAD